MEKNASVKWKKWMRRRNLDHAKEEGAAGANRFDKKMVEINEMPP